MATLTHYEILTQPLLSKYTTKSLDSLTEDERDLVYDNAANELINRVRSEEIWFPFQKYFRGDPVELFNNLKRITLPVTEDPFRLFSYSPK